MQRLQFRNYTFPTNPASIVLEKEPAIASHFCPGKGELLEPLGEKADRVVCQGSFWGNTPEAATRQLEAFWAAAGGREPGLLFLPFGPPLYCYIEQFSVAGQGDGCILPYTMVFVKAGWDAAAFWHNL